MTPLDNIVLQIINYYIDMGGYRQIPTDHRDCFNTCRLLGAEYIPDGALIYHTSITTNRMVTSSISGEKLQLLPVAEDQEHGIYWIKESEGYDNARIIAHIVSLNNDRSKMFAWVAR